MVNYYYEQSTVYTFGSIRWQLSPARREPHEAAKRLAFSMLTEKQRTSVAVNGYFEVRSNRWWLRHYWRIHTAGNSTMLNVRRLRKIGPWRVPMPLAYCAGHGHSVPVWDTYLAQAFMLETDERRFRMIANRL